MIKDDATKKEPLGFLNSIIGCSTKLPYHSSHDTLNDSHLTIVGSRSHSTKDLKDFVEDMKKKYRSVEFISAGSSLKLCLVAEGKADIYPRLGPTMEWDTAAGQIIVEEAHGSVLNSETNEPLRYNKKNLLNPWFIVRKKPT
jgi:3'(2'), 5'-bisphosphate nucleotidase